MNRRREPFRGAAAIITGGASGIGLAMGTELVAAHVVLADFDGDRAQRVAQRTLFTRESRSAQLWRS